jgi:ketosteroid isomerase-like protein
MTYSTLTIAVAALPCATVAWAQSPTAQRTLSKQDVAALRAIADQDASLVLNRDWATLASQYSEDAVRMPPNGPAVEGRAEIRRMLEALPPVPAFEFRMIDLQGDGEIAYMRAEWSITVEPPGAAPVSDSGKILIVFRKQEGGAWRRVADAWNSDLPVGE